MFTFAGALGGADVGSLACTLAQLTKFGASFGERYSNCLNEPLRWFNANPFDRVYLRQIESCERDQIVVRLGSHAGHAERRRFIYDRGRLRAISMVELFASGRDGTTRVDFESDLENEITSGRVHISDRATTELDRAQLSGLSPLLEDAVAYRGLCARHDRSPKSAPRAFDAVMPSDLHVQSR